MNNKMLTVLTIAASTAFFSGAIAQTPDSDLKWEEPFAKDGQYGENSSGWVVRKMEDVSEPPARPVTWEVKNKVLYGTGRFGANEKDYVPTWLLSAHKYTNFVLETEFRFEGDAAWADGGVALRVPLVGDPAYDGLELQIADERYQLHWSPNTTYPNSLTGSFYLLQAPTKQVAFKANEWNRYRVEVREQLIKVWFNGELIQDVNLGLLSAPGLRHGPVNEEFVLAKSGAERPLKGHIGFQDESEHGTYLMIRNTRIAELK